MRETIHVYVDLDGEAHYIGRMWVHTSGRREAASFQYDDSWLSNPMKFALEPALMLGSGDFHTDDGKALFGSIGDSAPDRWGRLLMSRAAKRDASDRGEAPRSMREDESGTTASLELALEVAEYFELGAKMPR